MRVVKLFLAVLIVCPPVISAGGRPDDIKFSGTAFLSTCSVFETESSKESGYDAVRCVAWVEGFVDGVLVSEIFHSSPEKEKMFCIPDGVSYLQVGRIIRKYIVEHPEREHLATKYLASEALVRAFPCKPGKYQP